MALKTTRKQPYEKYFCYGDFEPVMIEEETISVFAVTATDVDGLDVTSSIIEPGSPQIGTGENTQKLYFRIQAGTEDYSPYKFTVRVETSTGNKWEQDGKIKVKEI